VEAPQEKDAQHGRLVIIPGSEFRNGTILIDVAGEPSPHAPPSARGYVGVAFHLDPKTEAFESFYLRPTNGRSKDQLRRNHAVQYVSQPEYPFERLRRESPGEFESYVDLVPRKWTNMKIAVMGDHAQLYVNRADQPCLIVSHLKHGDTTGKVALWVGEGTIAWFKQLRIQRR
jgi:hypothetical protein